MTLYSQNAHYSLLEIYYIISLSTQSSNLYTDQYLAKSKHSMDYLENVCILRICHIWTITETPDLEHAFIINFITSWIWACLLIARGSNNIMIKYLAERIKRFIDNNANLEFWKMPLSNF